MDIGFTQSSLLDPSRMTTTANRTESISLPVSRKTTEAIRIRWTNARGLQATYSKHHQSRLPSTTLEATDASLAPSGVLSATCKTPEAFIREVLLASRKATDTSHTQSQLLIATRTATEVSRIQSKIPDTRKATQAIRSNLKCCMQLSRPCNFKYYHLNQGNTTPNYTNNPVLPNAFLTQHSQLHHKTNPLCTCISLVQTALTAQYSQFHQETGTPNCLSG